MGFKVINAFVEQAVNVHALGLHREQQKQPKDTGPAPAPCRHSQLNVFSLSRPFLDHISIFAEAQIESQKVVFRSPVSRLIVIISLAVRRIIVEIHVQE